MSTRKRKSERGEKSSSGTDRQLTFSDLLIMIVDFVKVLIVRGGFRGKLRGIHSSFWLGTALHGG